MKKILILGLVIASMVSCEKENEGRAGIFNGPEKVMHDGKTWSWVQVDGKGAPLRVGVTITEAVLNSVPVGEEGGHDGHQHDHNVVLELPAEGGVTPFKHVWLNWNPAGHPPMNIYTKPHFDIHFYMSSNTERQQYLDPVKLDASPSADYLPVNHIGVDPVPTMGKHFVDLTSPELNPANPVPFTQTFIYGSYDSKVVFYEPMITLDFLKNTTQFERSIPVPAKFQQSGYYPTRMRIAKVAHQTQVILEGFVYRTAS